MERRSFRMWMNEAITVRRRALFVTLFVVIVMIVGSQYQVAAQNEARVVSACETRVAARSDLRDVLFKVVDLSDLFDPATVTDRQTEFVDLYRSNRVDFINAKYPALNSADC